ncbi:MAG: hypothetical protein A4E65_03393 [Syntrophorhabdus sp. PtaU1.Bin153]|nr:MAG: hypothetical protein A4E65_03393 [Syntrophorhabdus sp. PtaU1.Bin153]
MEHRNESITNKTIQQKIIDFLKTASRRLVAVDVRVGLGFTSVRLDDGNLGLAWTAESRSAGCTHQPKAGTLAGSSAESLLDTLASLNNPLSRSIGLATANAIAAGFPRLETTTIDILQLLNIQESDHVVMVGYFGPLIPTLRSTGCRLDIIELKSDKPGTLSPDEGRAPLSVCSVALITGTSIATGTMDGLLSNLGNPRAAVILGPSTFMRPEVFAGSPVTHLSGSRVRNAPAVERIVSEGGGTMILKQHMDFETICLKP